MKRKLLIFVVIVLAIIGSCIIINWNNYKYFSFYPSIFQEKESSISVDDSKNISKTFVKEYIVRARSIDSFDIEPTEIWIEKQWYHPNLLGFIKKNNDTDAYFLNIKSNVRGIAPDLLFFLDYKRKYDFLSAAFKITDNYISVQEIYTDYLPDTCFLYLVRSRLDNTEVLRNKQSDTIQRYLLINKACF